MTAWGQQPDLFTRRVRKPPLALERETHIALADTLRVGLASGWWWCHVPNGELRPAKTGALLQRMGARSGVFDFTLISPTGQVHFLEMKRDRAPLTEAQRQFQLEMNMRGVPCAVARNYEAALEQLKAWGAVKTTLRVAA